MKKSTYILHICFLLLITGKSFCQIKTGTYSNKNEFISFRQDSVVFNLKNYGCIIKDLQGKGSYRVMNNFLLIETKPYNSKSYHIKSENTSDSIKIQVADLKHTPIVLAIIETYDNSGELLFGTLTDQNGLAIIEKINNISKISVSSLGFYKYIFDYAPNANYHVFLDEERVENQTMAFKINSTTTNAMELVLLTTNLEPTQNITAALEQLCSTQKNCSQNIKQLKASN